MNKRRHWVYKIYPEKSIERINAKIKLLGKSAKYDSITLLNTRTIITIILFFSLLLFNKYGYFLAPISAILFYVISEKILLDYPLKNRIKVLEKEAIFFFEILSLTIETGSNLTKAIETTTSNVDGELSEEFKKMLAEIKLGKSFIESLDSLHERIPSEPINNIILSIRQSSILGSSITGTLNNQLEYLREKQILDIKAEITKLPTKISIVSVTFFIPIMLLIILAPVIIEFLAR